MAVLGGEGVVDRGEGLVMDIPRTADEVRIAGGEIQSGDGEFQYFVIGDAFKAELAVVGKGEGVEDGEGDGAAVALGGHFGEDLPHQAAAAVLGVGTDAADGTANQLAACKVQGAEGQGTTAHAVALLGDDMVVDDVGGGGICTDAVWHVKAPF
jgi:hypothetical protein